jgi:ankyrin repeat protein
MSKAANQQLFDAASRGDLEAVKAALAQGANLEADDAGFTALTFATRNGHADVVMYLLEQGAKVTNTTLIVASKSAYSNSWLLGLLQLAQMKQVKPKTTDHSRPDAQLLRAAYNGSLSSLKKAIKAGANVNVSDDQDTSALRWAARGGHRDVVEALLDAGADINQRSFTGWTAMMEAVVSGSEDIVSMLIERGADLNVKTFANASALYFARDIVQYSTDEDRARRIIKLLEEHGAEYSEPQEDED